MSSTLASNEWPLPAWPHLRARVGRSLKSALAEAALAKAARRDSIPPVGTAKAAGGDAGAREMIVRLAGAADIDEIIDVQARANAASLSHVFDAANPLPMGLIASRWRAALASENFRFAVCTDRGTIVGVSQVGGSTFHALQIVPEYWGAGVAALLHDDALDELRASGQRRVVARVMERNDRARAFWTKHGWTLLPWRPTLSQYPPHPRVLTYALLLDATSRHRAQALAGQALLRLRSAA